MSSPDCPVCGSKLLSLKSFAQTHSVEIKKHHFTGRDMVDILDLEQELARFFAHKRREKLSLEGELELLLDEVRDKGEQC